MSIVWHTNLELGPGKTYDTRSWYRMNRKALAEASPAAREVEELLEEVRQEQFPELPERLSSILAVPWPEHPYSDRRVREGKVFDPPGVGAFCYYLALTPETNRRMLDEKYVTELIRVWPNVRNSHERWGIAAEYWDGALLESYSLLIQGPVTIESPCSGGDVPLVERIERGYPHREGFKYFPPSKKRRSE